MVNGQWFIVSYDSVNKGLELETGFGVGTLQNPVWSLNRVL